MGVIQFVFLILLRFETTKKVLRSWTLMPFFAYSAPRACDQAYRKDLEPEYGARRGETVREAKEPTFRISPFFLLASQMHDQVERNQQLTLLARARPPEGQTHRSIIFGKTIFVILIVALTLISTTFSISLSGHSWK